MPTATFVLSTGRCGTQWLAAKLAEVYGDLLAVEHEPLHGGYQPRRMLGLKTPLALDPEGSNAIQDHLARVEGLLEAKSYVECGHPCWSTLPYLLERFAGRIRVVHLSRHPIPTALSWLTHSAYEPPFLPHLQEKVLLSPHDDGVMFPEYREPWATMSPFEKCLYYWAEVNAFGLDLEHRAGAPWLRLSFEELFTPAGIGRVLDFLSLPARPSMLDARLDVVDQHRFKVASNFPDLAVLAHHPRFVEVATSLGYSVSWENIDQLKDRYTLPGH